jgi:hypothetical protein
MSDELMDLQILDELGAALVAGFRRREASWLRAPKVRFAAVATAAAIGAGAVLVSQLGGGGTAQASAAQLLRAAANAAATAPARLPKPSQFLVVSWRTVYLAPVRSGPLTPLTIGQLRTPKAVVTEIGYDAWSATRTGQTNGRVLSVTFRSVAARALWVRLGRPRLGGQSGPMEIAPGSQIAIGRAGITPQQLLRLPAKARVIERRLFAGAGAANVLDYVSTIALYPIAPRLRAAVYRAMTLVPGIRFEGRARTLTGQVGIAFGAPAGAVRADLIIDPRTGGVLGNRTVVIDSTATGLPVGTVYFQQTVTERAITDSPRPPQHRTKHQ